MPRRGAPAKRTTAGATLLKLLRHLCAPYLVKPRQKGVITHELVHQVPWRGKHCWVVVTKFMDLTQELTTDSVGDVDLARGVNNNVCIKDEVHLFLQDGKVSQLLAVEHALFSSRKSKLCGTINKRSFIVKALEGCGEVNVENEIVNVAGDMVALAGAKVGVGVVFVMTNGHPEGQVLDTMSLFEKGGEFVERKGSPRLVLQELHKRGLVWYRYGRETFIHDMNVGGGGGFKERGWLADGEQGRGENEV